VHIPKIGIWADFAREQDEVFGKVRLLIEPPAAALAFCQARLADRWAEHRRSLARHGLYAETPSMNSFPAAVHSSTAIGHSSP
jgi:hypothetical protein